MIPNISPIFRCLRFWSMLQSAIRAIFYFFLLIFSPSNYIICQPPVSIPVSLLDLRAGMENEGNYFCYKDSRDLLWMSSYAGLHRFDGKNIKVFRPGANSIYGKEVVSNICEDAFSNIWFGTNRALNCFVREKGNFKKFSLHEDDRGDYKVQGIDVHGKIWVTFEQGIYAFDPLKQVFDLMASIDLHKEIDEIVLMTEYQKDGNGEVILTYSYGSYDDDPGLEIHNFTKGTLVDERIYFDKKSKLPLRIHDVFSISDSTILLAALEGFFRCNIKSGALEYLWSDNEGRFDGCTGIVRFTDSTFLIADQSAIFIEYHLEKKRVLDEYVLDHKGVTLIDAPRYMNTDNQGGIYIYLERRGLAYFHPKNLLFKHRKYPVKTGDQPGLIVLRGLIERPDGKVFGSSHQNGGFLFSEKGEVVETYNTESEVDKRLKNNRIAESHIDSKGRIWMITSERNISRFNTPAMKNITSFKTDVEIHRMINIPGIGLFFGAANGRILINKSQNNIALNLMLPEKYNENIHLVTAGLHENGLLYAKQIPQKLAVINPAKGFIPIKSIPFLPGIFNVQSIAGTNNFLLGSDAGPYFVNGTTDSIEFLDYSLIGKDAMIFCFIPMGDDNYLISSDRGVCTINLKNRSSVRYGSEHGLVMQRFNYRAFIHHSRGNIWLGNNSGITTCDPINLEKTHFGNRVNIYGININDDPTDVTWLKDQNSENMDEIEGIELNYKFNTISFQFAAFSYAGINQHEYEHRMFGLEENWVDGGDRGFARYSNLPSGNYTFESRVKDQPESVRAVALNIHPPLWGRIWFQLLLILSTLGILYYTFLTRERRKQHIQKLQFERRIALEQERVRIATDMHDDIGSSLSALNMRAQILATRQNKGEVKDQLNLLAQNSRHLTQKIREIIWTVNAKNDTIENLVTRLHQYALEFFENTNIICNIEIMEEQNDQQIEGHHRRDIYLVFKEALNNIYKHADANEVAILIAMPEPGRLNISVSDNGQGFDISTKFKNGNGLNSMRNRIEKMGGKLDIDSSEEGTTIFISTPT